MSGPSDLARARIYVDNERYDEAARVLATYLASSGDDAEAWRLLAQASIGVGQLRTAQDAAERSLNLEPGSEWGHRLLSLVLCRLETHGPARMSADEAIRCDPTSWRAHRQRAEVDIVAKTVGPLTWEAARCAVALAPDESAVHITAGRVALAARRNRVAAEAFSQALRIDPNDAVARNNLAVVRLRQRRLTAAGRHLVGALRLDPTSDLFTRNLRVLLRTWASVLLGASVIGCVLVIGVTAGHDITVPGFPPVLSLDPADPGSTDAGSPILQPGQEVVFGTQTLAASGLPSTVFEPSTVHVPAVGRPAGLIEVASVLLVVLGGALIGIRRSIGPAAGRIMAAELRRDRRLVLTAVSALLSVGTVLVAAVLGMPAARTIVSVAVFVDLVALFGLRILRRSHG